MIDATGRVVDYMRVSITDRCNLRCRYCMPDGIEQVEMAQILTYEEIKRACTLAAGLGIRKIKITGGEPLVRKGCVDLVKMIKEIPGVSQVTMTTNGILLKEHLNRLMQAGLDGVNISLDTLSRKKYQNITGTDACETVRQAIVAAAESGMRTKVNAVLQIPDYDRGIDDNDDWQELVSLAENLPVDVRFIELMPIGYGKKNQGVSNIDLLEEIRKKYPKMQKDTKIHGNGPAVYYKIPGFAGGVGFISAMHGKFCAACNRIRLTSTGELKPCLCYGKTYPLRELLRDGTDMQVEEQIKKAIWEKPAAHCFEDPEGITEEHQMAQIGG